MGVLLRIAGAAFVFACCLMLWRFARDLWGPREGLAAALLLGFFLTFGIPAAVMALAPDLLMVLPHIAAVYLAWRGRPLLSGLMAGVALLVNAKAFFVLAACVFFALARRWMAACRLRDSKHRGADLVRTAVRRRSLALGRDVFGTNVRICHRLHQDRELGGVSKRADCRSGICAIEGGPLAMENGGVAAPVVGCGGGGLAIFPALLFPTPAGDGSSRCTRVHALREVPRGNASALVDPADPLRTALCDARKRSGSRASKCLERSGAQSGQPCRSGSSRALGITSRLGLPAGYFRLHQAVRRQPLSRFATAYGRFG